MQPRPAATPPLLRIENVNKSFGPVRALVDARLELSAGEIHAVVGENGAGKSTLIRILSGLIRPDNGELVFNGRPVKMDTPAVSRALGIAVIHQDFDLPPNLKVIDSLLLGQEPEPRLGFVRPALRRRVALEGLQRVGLDVDPDAMTGALSASDRQLLAVARAIRKDARVLVMDEPTSALAPDEAARLLTLVRQLRSRGLSVIFVSHKLNEVFEISDRVTVLRDGSSVGTYDISATSKAELVTLMVGRALGEQLHGSAAPRGEKLLEVRELHREGAYHRVSFELCAGEILGLYGLQGAGRTALLRGLFGLEPPESGEVRIDARKVRVDRPQDAVRNGISLVPEDRKAQALFSNMNCRENLTLTVLDTLQTLGFVRRADERTLAMETMRRLAVRAEGPEQPIDELSGGNQQKIVLGRWLVRQPGILLLDEPTAGIDVGAKAEIYQTIRRMVSEGKGVILATSEMTELLGVCDRILVMADGHIVGEFDREAVTEEAIMRAIQGH